MYKSFYLGLCPCILLVLFCANQPEKLVGTYFGALRSGVLRIVAVVGVVSRWNLTVIVAVTQNNLGV